MSNHWFEKILLPNGSLNVQTRWYPRPVTEADFAKTYKANSLTYLVVVAVRVCNSDKLNSIDLHFLFDSARPVVLQFIQCSCRTFWR